MAAKTTYSIIAIAVLAVAGYALVMPRWTDGPGTAPDNPAGEFLVEVTVPTLTGTAKIGETAFNAKCAACHGENAAGLDGKAPPLIHKIYEPSHHGDMSFQMAVQNGVRSHHWPFGDMAPVEGLTKADVKNIVAYVRSLQQANGIF